MNSKLLSAYCLSLCCAFSVLAEDPVVDIAPGEQLVLERRAEPGIRIDGNLTKEIWRELPAYDEFLVIEPDTLAEVPHATLVRLFYSTDGLYVGVDMIQPV